VEWQGGGGELCQAGRRHGVAVAMVLSITKRQGRSDEIFGEKK